MKRKVNKKIKIKEYTASVDGSANFRGGPYGFGGQSQLATNLNPATQKMKDQEDAEFNKNTDDLMRINGIHKTNKQMATRLKDFDVAPTAVSPKRLETDMFAPGPHGPGNKRENALVEPKTFVPFEKPRNKDEYLVDDMAEEIFEEIIKILKKSKINEAGFVDYSNTLYSRHTNVDLNPKNSNETIGHTAVPTATHVSSVGMGSVLLPKAFVPEDQIAKNNNKNPNTGLSTISGEPNIDQRLQQQEEMEKEELNEKFASKKQAAYFYAQANKGGQEGKKWKKMADEFSSKTDFSKLKENKINKLKLLIKKIILEEIKKVKNVK